MKFKKDTYFKYDRRFYKILNVGRKKVWWVSRIPNPVERGKYLLIEGWQWKSVLSKVFDEKKAEYVAKLIGMLKMMV